MEILQKVLNNEEENFLFPFFWIRGEDENVLRKYVNKVYETGIREICVESRPHPNYLGDQYWKDIEVIIDEVEKLDMRIWLVDDEHFPTGSAAGRIKKEYPHLQKKFLRLRQIDVYGPIKNSFYDLKFAYYSDRSSIFNNTNDKKNISDNMKPKIVKVLAAKKTGMNGIDINSLVDVTEYYDSSKEILRWEVPSGSWKILVVVETYDGGEDATRGYLNPLNKESTNVLIDTVYESHFEKFGDKFGKSIAGFFSDEPRFGNIKGPDASIGRVIMDLPWHEDVYELLKDRYGKEIDNHLPLLFIGEGSQANKIRYQYMDIVSKLYSKNFSDVIGDWCKKHGVEYTGHIIEDNNAHSRLGYGAGHFFRSMSGQSISGIDVVLHQLLPGHDDDYFHSMTSTGWDGEFFHYALAKLGSSLGHLDGNKENRSMVELFGAYGWNEGLPLMKWLVDHMLVRGITHFVPHAFSLKEYPDFDCPPHFYAHGNNPQYKYFYKLVNYMNRSSHILSRGIHNAEVAVLYHAEGEWSGEYQLVQKPARELMENQIDFDIVSADYLNNSKITDSNLIIGKERFKKIIVPYAETLPINVLNSLSKISENGVEVIFIDDIPTKVTEGKKMSEFQNFLNNTKVVQLKDLSEYLLTNDIYTIKLDHKFKHLRVLNKINGNSSYYMITNEHPTEDFKGNVYFREKNNFLTYDAMENKIETLCSQKHDDLIKVNLNLRPSESTILVFNEEIESSYEMRNTNHEESIVNNVIEIEVMGEKYTGTNIENVEIPLSYSGDMIYKIKFYDREEYNKVELILTEVNEIAEVKLNEEYINVRITEPYSFDLSNDLKKGENTLIIKITNNLGNIQQDYLSQFLPTKLIGIHGDIRLKFSKKEENTNE